MTASMSSTREPEVMQTRSVRGEELDVQTSPAYRLQQLDLHVAAPSESEFQRARHLLATEVVAEIVGRKIDEVAAPERRPHRVLRGGQIGNDVGLLEQTVANLFEQRADLSHGAVSRARTAGIRR